MSTFEGKTAVVVGAGGGIGGAVALAFARAGARLVLSGRNEDALEATRSECGSDHVCIEPVDVSQPEDVSRLVDRVTEMFGGIDVAINAAGVHGAIGPAHECDPHEWRRALDVNLYGSFLLAREVAPAMLARGSGRIILFSGGGATSPLPGFSAYAASKAGLVRLVETLAEELRPHVQVNAIAPGLVDTALLDEVIAAGDRAGDEFDQVRRMRKGELKPVPAQLSAELAVFLAGRASSALTGRLISAPHDQWREWIDGAEPAEGLYTLRRLDEHSVKPLLAALT